MAASILVADDDLSIRMVLSHYLEMIGYTVSLAADGEQALGQIVQTLPQLVITDMSMPRMDGPTLIRELRKQEHLQKIPVICLTGHAKYQSFENKGSETCSALITKPFDLAEVADTVQNLLMGNKP